MPWFKTFVSLFMLSLFPALAAAQPVRGVAGDLWADRILGQADNGIPNSAFGQITFNEASAKAVNNNGGRVVDTLHNILWVWDSGNNRILGVNLTGLTSGQGAQIVLGQPDFQHTGENEDSNYQHYPMPPQPTASTLGGLWYFFDSPAEAGSGAGMAVDPLGNLYVPDFYNNRVLRYDWPIATGQSASHVWGQVDFTHNWYNQTFPPFQDSNGYNYGGTLPLPTASTLGFWPYLALNSYQAGVAIDAWGNLWVADTVNERVIRFPNTSGTIGAAPSTIADVVLGQSGFTTHDPNLTGMTDLTQMNEPNSVRVDAQGNVYVADSTPPRLLIFEPTGSSAGVPTYTNGQAAVTAYNQYVGFPSGLEWDAPVAAGGTGGLWVTDFSNNQIVLLQINYSPSLTITPLKVLGHDFPATAGSPGSGCGGGQGGSLTGDNAPFTFTDNTPSTTNTYVLCNPSAPVGVDGAGNVFATFNGLQDVWRFPAPIPTPVLGIAHDADIQVFQPSQFGTANTVNNVGFSVPGGVAVAAAGGTTQIIVGDNLRLRYWTMPSSGPAGLANGQPQDGYAGTSTPNLQLAGKNFSRICNDRAGHLFAIRGGLYVDIFNLPLSNGQAPAATLSVSVPVLGGGSVTWGRLDGLAVDPTGTTLWLVDQPNSRVFRVHNPLTAPMVDILLGQPNATSTACDGNGTVSPYAANGGCPGGTITSASTLNQPGAVVLDHHGDLFISDDSLETEGNYRLLRWNSTDFSANPPSCQFAIPADFVYGRSSLTATNCDNLPPSGVGVCNPWEPAFNSDDSVMVVGMNGQGGFRFPVVLQNPRSGDNPVTYLQDFASHSYSGVFDDQDNYYVTDINRERLLIYFQPFVTATFTSTPTQTPTTTPTASPTSSQTPTVTLTPATTLTSTPTLSPTTTASLTPTPSPTVTPTSTPTATPSATITATPTEGCHDPGFYPNPCSDTLHVHFSPCDQGREAHAKIFTVVDRKVLDKDIPQVPIGTDFSLELKDNWGVPLANGLYYLVIDGVQGRSIGKLLILR